MDHLIRRHQSHVGWDNSIEPVLMVGAGASVTFEVQDASGGQLRKGATVGDIGKMNFDLCNPLTGPVTIADADPGDAIRVTVEEFEPSGWGWTANLPGFGLLADQFPDPALIEWDYDARTLAPAAWNGIARVPLRPFAGCLGLAPAEGGTHDVIPPRRVGGNLDMRELCAGSEVWLPVEVPGGLLSVGDTHAAQGDGEVCGTAIESPMTVRLRLDLEKGAAPHFPRVRTAAPPTPERDTAGCDITTGIGPDLMQAARDAVSGMIDLLSARHGIAPVEAYMLCSVAADLRISEIVDLPNVVVSLHFPRAVFE